MGGNKYKYNNNTVYKTRITHRVCTERTRRGDGKISLDSSDKLK